MDLHTMLEMGENLTANLQPQTLTGFLVAFAFLVVVRGFAWAWKRPTNSQLAASILQTLDTANPAHLETLKGGSYRLGNLGFDNKNGVTSINGRSVGKDNLSRKERRQINRKIAALMVRQKSYENTCLANLLTAGATTALVAEQAPTTTDVEATVRKILAERVPTMPTTAVRTVAPAPVTALATKTDAQRVSECFTGKWPMRSIDGIVKQTKLDRQRVLAVLNGGAFRRNKTGTHYSRA